MFRREYEARITIQSNREFTIIHIPEDRNSANRYENLIGFLTTLADKIEALKKEDSSRKISVLIEQHDIHESNLDA